MPIPLLDEMIEKELEEAFEVKNKEALHRYVRLIVESFSEKGDVKDLGHEMKGSFKSLEGKVEAVNNKVFEVREEIKLLIEMMNKRFEEQRAYTDKKFEELLHYSDKRFEDLLRYSDKRFEEINKKFEEQKEYSDKRFEEINRRFEEQRAYTDKKFEELLHYSDKRFEDLLHYSDKRFEDMNKRFEDMNKRFNLITWLIGIGFTVITVMITVFKFLF